MRMSALADAAGLPVATVKFYLRVGVLPPGRKTSATSAEYDDAHLRRLRLVRALVEVGDMRLADVQRVLRSVDDPGTRRHDVFGAVHEPLADVADGPEPAQLAVVDQLLERLGWRIRPGSPDRAALARALQACADVGHPFAADQLLAYAGAARTVAEVDVDHVPTDDLSAALETVLVGTVLRGPVLLALRRLAHVAVSAERFG